MQRATSLVRNFLSDNMNGKDRKTIMISLGAPLDMARHHKICFNCSDKEMSLATRLKNNLHKS